MRNPVAIVLQVAWAQVMECRTLSAGSVPWPPEGLKAWHHDGIVVEEEDELFLPMFCYRHGARPLVIFALLHHMH